MLNQEFIVSNVIEIGQLVLQEKTFHLVNEFYLFPFYLTMNKGRNLHSNKHETPLSKNAMSQAWLKPAWAEILYGPLFKKFYIIFYFLE